MTSPDTLSAARSRVGVGAGSWAGAQAEAAGEPGLDQRECLSSAIAPGLYRPPSYSLDALRADLNRFTFLLLGGNDGEFLLGEDPPNARNRPRLRSVLLANKITGPAAKCGQNSRKTAVETHERSHARTGQRHSRGGSGGTDRLEVRAGHDRGEDHAARLPPLQSGLSGID